jgi:NIMA (never in mitosis gene a)-related kinase
MEYANGGDISQKIKTQKPKNFDENLLIDWLTQLCHALQYIHNKKIIHRDIKPDNIFLNNLGQIKLGDFGVSKNLESMKMASTFIGSIDYLAPEIIDGKNYSFEADIWSLGVTFYELMTFEKPFKGNFPAVFLKIMKDEVEPINDYYSKEFRNLIYSMLNKDPNKRPTAKEILKMGFIKKRMLSYLQEKKFNFKDSFNLIQNYQKKKYKKFSSNNVNNNIDRKNMNNLNIKYNINFNERSDKKGLSNTSNKKLRFINSKNPNININTINDNSHIKYKFNLKSDKEINKNLLNERYKFMDEKGDNNDKESGKDKFNNFRHSVQVPEKRNKINISKTKITNGAIGSSNQEDKKVKIKELTASHQNYSKNLKFNLLKNDKKRDIYEINNSPYEKNVKITVNDFNDTNNLNDKDKDKYDFHRQMNIYSSLIRGEKTDEQIEEENNILLKNYD